MCIDLAVIDPSNGAVIDSERFAAGKPTDFMLVIAVVNWVGEPCQRVNTAKAVWEADPASPTLRASRCGAMRQGGHLRLQCNASATAALEMLTSSFAPPTAPQRTRPR